MEQQFDLKVLDLNPLRYWLLGYCAREGSYLPTYIGKVILLTVLLTSLIVTILIKLLAWSIAIIVTNYNTLLCYL